MIKLKPTRKQLKLLKPLFALQDSFTEPGSIIMQAFDDHFEAECLLNRYAKRVKNIISESRCCEFQPYEKQWEKDMMRLTKKKLIWILRRALSGE